MNILPRNPADREAKSPCDKNIRYPVCGPGHDSPNGTTFLTIVVYDKQNRPSWMTQVTCTTLVRWSPGRKPLDLRSLGLPGDNLLVWSGHLDHPRGWCSYYVYSFWENFNFLIPLYALGGNTVFLVILYFEQELKRTCRVHTPLTYAFKGLEKFTSKFIHIQGIQGRVRTLPRKLV
jgi:hypothetical protein